MTESFYNPYTHGFFRCAAASCEVRIGDPFFNVQSHLEMAEKASKQFAGMVVFPELGLSGYSLQDIFFQKALLRDCQIALEQIIKESSQLFPLLIVGLPVLINDRLFNCAAIVHRGSLLGLVPKTFLPNHFEFYEKRHFSPADQLDANEIVFLGEKVPVGTDLIFKCKEFSAAKIAVEICEDLWAPVSPATSACLAGANLIANLSASNVVIGKADYRRLIIKSFSGKNICGYIYTSAGQGESTTDLAWDGHAIIAENATIIKENERFSPTGNLTIADLDADLLTSERIRYSTFKDAKKTFSPRHKEYRFVNFCLEEIPETIELQRNISTRPYIPKDSSMRNNRCCEIFNMQIQALTTRMQSSGINKLVVGVSGGLDSTLALIVACKAADELELDRKNVIGCTMPGFATSEHTKNCAHNLMKALHVTSLDIDIIPSATQMLRDLKHPFIDGERVYDITFENVQAGERTSHLFRLANQHKAMVVGTGDLSELALGWCTYGVGDHMSHYNVNASIPKTLVQYLIRWAADTSALGDNLSSVLYEILELEITPELVPTESHEDKPQSSQAVIGPYELQDFNLYYISRFGFSPAKVAYLCYNAWKQAEKPKYDLKQIKKWLEVFVKRFLQTSQFKRSCMPDSPKIGSGGSLSPRGDWRAPSDLTARIWLNEIKTKIP
jgi:NAD+ synthase (glutamine-hydrolysing)